MTDIHTGWTETTAVKNKAQKWVFAALVGICEEFPFPVKGIDSDNGSEFINHHLLRWCEYNKLTFTRSRAGRKNDGAHVEQKNWSVVRRAVGYHRYDTTAELDLLNQIYDLLRLQTNYFSRLPCCLTSRCPGTVLRCLMSWCPRGGGWFDGESGWWVLGFDVLE